MMKALILTEGNAHTGFGHVTRCKALAQILKKSKIQTELIINGDDSIRSLLNGVHYSILNWLKLPSRLFLKISKADFIVIDSYLATLSHYQKLYAAAKKVIYIDDNNRIGYPPGIILNGGIHAASLKYPRKKGHLLLLGPQYVLLRKEFWHVPPKKINKEVKNVLITFGGDDIRNMTPKIILLLKKEFPYLQKKVVIAKGFKKIDEIEKVADDRTTLVYFPDSKKMKSLMLECDITISAGGQTINELARVGTPAIIVTIADNQEKQVKSWAKTGFIYNAGWFNHKNLLYNLKCSVEDSFKVTHRTKISNLGKKLYGANPFNNIPKAITVWVKK